MDSFKTLVFTVLIVKGRKEKLYCSEMLTLYIPTKLVSVCVTSYHIVLLVLFICFISYWFFNRCVSPIYLPLIDFTGVLLFLNINSLTKAGRRLLSSFKSCFSQHLFRGLSLNINHWITLLHACTLFTNHYSTKHGVCVLFRAAARSMIVSRSLARREGESE